MIVAHAGMALLFLMSCTKGLKMQNQNFPLVEKNNLWLSCFNCYQDLYGFDFFESDNAKSRGRFYACCESCGMRTFFDFIETDNAAQTN